jgi:hypothetical protein
VPSQSLHGIGSRHQPQEEPELAATRRAAVQKYIVLTYISTGRAEIRLTRETEPRRRCVVSSSIRALALGACRERGRGHISSPLQELLRLNGSLAIAAARLAIVRVVACYTMVAKVALWTDGCAHLWIWVIVNGSHMLHIRHGWYTWRRRRLPRI